ncbi:MAG: hypothetical protein J7K57_00720 [Palaeococcus sp.]|uniref:hypothetical protein n=1 Tax=Palaeococcus sp. (in: euryarchaeotes) TaxID=2820298 RepID=UPI0025E9DBBC|nr:hypothetical protein [Palaeococcus sp. (in: euryarchaeotes)]MCD6558397.1 hypothetical protein [Palaeococcus sp. (in: euryarchaeotes)]
MKRLLALLVGVLVIGATAGVIKAQPVGSRQIKPQDAGGYWKVWKVESVSYSGEYFDPSLTSCASTDPQGGIAGDYVVCRNTVIVSNRYYGELKVSIDTLSANVGFDVTQSFSQTAGYNAIVQYDGQYVEIFYGNVYDNYTVIQRLYEHIDGGDYPVSYVDPVPVYALKWKRFYYSVYRRDGA